MPSPPPLDDSARVTSGPPVSALAVSARVFAGTSAVVDSPGVPGFQGSVRTASRYLSVAARVSASSSNSRRTPVSTGNVSSRPAARATWATAPANTSLSSAPAVSGISGRDG